MQPLCRRTIFVEELLELLEVDLFVRACSTHFTCVLADGNMSNALLVGRISLTFGGEKVN